MAEKTTKRKISKRSSEEVRQHVRAAREEMRESIKAFLPPNLLSTAGRHAKKFTGLAQ